MKREELYSIISEYNVKDSQISEMIDRIIELNNATPESLDEFVTGAMNHLNKRLSTRFSKKNKTNLKLLKSLHKDKVSIEEVCKVIDFKIDKWRDDPRMRNYLKPGTLFANSNFHKYLDEANNENIVINNDTAFYEGIYDKVKSYLKDSSNSIQLEELTNYLNRGEINLVQFRELDSINRNNRANKYKSI